MNDTTEKYNCECYICNKPIYKMPYQLRALKDGKPTCSNKCSAQKRKKDYNCKCCICDKPLKRSPYQLSKLEDGKPVCSKECMGIKKTKKHTKPKYKCFICGNKFHRAKNQIDRLKDKRLTCSRECANEKKAFLEKESIENKLNISDFKVWLENKYHEEKLNTRDIAEIIYGKRNHSPNVLGWMEKFGIDTRERSEAVALQWVDNPERKKDQAKFMKENFGNGTLGRMKIIELMQTEEYKMKASEAKIGSKNPMWKPELTADDRQDRNKSPINARWVRAVKRRDNYTCQCCGIAGVTMVAHHLNGYNWDVENRYNVDNGITLCERCHIDFHRIYGNGDNTKEQFEEYLNKIKNNKVKQLALF